MFLWCFGVLFSLQDGYERNIFLFFNENISCSWVGGRNGVLKGTSSHFKGSVLILGVCSRGNGYYSYWGFIFFCGGMFLFLEERIVLILNEEEELLVSCWGGGGRKGGKERESSSCSFPPHEAGGTEPTRTKCILRGYYRCQKSVPNSII